MEKNDSSLSPGVGDSSNSHDSRSIERRRAVLKGMSSAAAIAGAVGPGRALATGGQKHCFHKERPEVKCKATVSGMHSVISSVMASEWPESPGKHCSYYKTSWNWPKDGYGKSYCYGKFGQKFYRTAAYKDVFGCAGGGNNDKTIGEIMDQQLAPHCNWVTACLNSTKYGTQFSYSPHEVTALHNDAGRCLDALYFFKNYQENYYS